MEAPTETSSRNRVGQARSESARGEKGIEPFIQACETMRQEVESFRLGIKIPPQDCLLGCPASIALTKFFNRNMLLATGPCRQG